MLGLEINSSWVNGNSADKVGDGKIFSDQNISYGDNNDNDDNGDDTLGDCNNGSYGYNR